MAKLFSELPGTDNYPPQETLSPYERCLARSLPLADGLPSAQSEPTEIGVFCREQQLVEESAPAYAQCLRHNASITSDLPPVQDDTVPISEIFPTEEDDVLEALVRESAQDRADKRRPIENLKKSVTDKSMGLSEVRKILQKKHDFKVIDGTCYIRVGVTWYELTKQHLTLLCSTLPGEIYDGLPDRAGKEIYQKIVNQQTLRVHQDDLRTSPNLIPCLDGVYDVMTGKVYDSALDNDFFYCVNIRISEIGRGSGAQYERFLERSFGDAADAIRCLEQCQGVMLSGYTPKKIYVYAGPTSSGKSVCGNLLKEYLKNHTEYGSGLCFIKSLDSPNRLSENFGLGDLVHKQLCLCGDMAKVGISAKTCAILKQLSGNDIIRGEAKYAPSFEFVNTAKLLFLSNNPLRGSIDEALADRLVVVPFSYTVPPEERIANFECELFRDRGYIFYRYMQALRRLIDNDFEFVHVDGSESWVIGGSAAPDNGVQRFVQQRCSLDPSALTPTKTLHDAYLQFCIAASFSPVTDSAQFGKKLQASCPGLVKHRTKYAHGYRGIKLSAQFEG